MSLDVNNLLAQADAILQELLQGAQERAPLAKAEKAYKAEEEKEELKEELEEKKEEEKKEEEEEKKEMQKEEDKNLPHYESQSPETESPKAEVEEELDLPAMVKELDDETLQQLFEHIKNELMARSAPAAEEKKPAAEEKKDEAEVLKMSERLQAELAQKDKQIAELNKTLSSLMELVETIASRPVQRAVTDVSVVERGGKLQKSDSPEDLRKSVYNIMGDKEKMALLSPKELDDLLGYYSGAPYKNLEQSVRNIIEKVSNKQ
ncbi:MAG: hypothetical protein QXT45_07785 [Candidatus Bilamarchaeaceae archaeon]